MTIIRKTERIESVHYSRSFVYADDNGAGYGFDCDESGVVDLEALHPVARGSYDACLTGIVNGREVVDDGVRRFVSRWTQPAILRCACRREVELSGFTNPCECGRDYNGSGQILAPREQWGEETGESLGDILSIR